MHERRAPDDGTRVLLPFPLSPPVAVEEGPGFPDAGPRQWYRELLQLHRLAADGGKSTRAPAPAARRARRPGKPVLLATRVWRLIFASSLACFGLQSSVLDMNRPTLKSFVAMRKTPVCLLIVQFPSVLIHRW